MKRPPSWPFLVLALLVLVLAAEHALFAWIAPRYVLYLVRSTTGGTIAIRSAQLGFPFTTTLKGLHWIGNSEPAGLSIRRMTIRPRWVSFRTRQVWLRSVTLEDALFRVTREPDGTLTTPSLVFSSPSGTAPGMPKPHMPWTVHVDTIKVEGGVLELMDTKTRRPFHGVIQHASFVMGPLTLPRVDTQTTFALRAQFSGDAGHAAPFYCSGWFNALAKDLQASCRVEPLPLAALDPYYPSGRVKVRVYDAAVRSTSQWQARQNSLTSDIQLTMNHLSEGDLSVMGRTILDVPAVTGGQEVNGAVSLTGPLDNPALWEAHFLPGDERVEQLLAPLLEHGIQFVKVPFVGRGVRITAPSTDMSAEDIQKATERIERELEILAPVAAPQVEPPAAPPPE
ncbi:MAG: DUF748 domain-containing protein, partial [Dehalococcoidia bacterium]|nr:DUF748 domain-containing protein [Dehalococcoidia bacterium]